MKAQNEGKMTLVECALIPLFKHILNHLMHLKHLKDYFREEEWMILKHVFPSIYK